MLAGRVVDDRNVVGVERVPGTQQERRDPDADTEPTADAELELARHDDSDQHAPAKTLSSATTTSVPAKVRPGFWSARHPYPARYCKPFAIVPGALGECPGSALLLPC